MLDPEPLYWPQYCEENVWHLGAHPALAGRAAAVLFISNHARQVALWHQRAATAPAEPVLWDYHVVLLGAAASARSWEVWDLDSTLGAPIAAADYLDATFAPAARETTFGARFRLVDLALYRTRLQSDRRHMRVPGGGWLAPPPPWPPIGGTASGSNLMRFVDVAAPFLGRSFDLEGLSAHLAQTAPPAPAAPR